MRIRDRSRAAYRAWIAVLMVMLLLPMTAPLARGQEAGANRIVVALPELVSSFDYPYDWAIVATWVHSNISDCLVWRDRESGEFVPWLAESVDNVDDTTWRLKLREGINFTNGEPFNAEAAKFTIDRILADPKALVYAQWTFISEVKVVDDSTIDIITAAPEPAFLSRMAGTGCQVVPPAYYQEVGNEGFAQAPIGLGPYTMEEFVKDDHVTLKANPDYWRGTPQIEEVDFRVIPEASTRVAELLEGGVDVVSSVPVQDVERLESAGNITLQRFITPQVMILSLRAGPSPESMPEFNGVTTDPKVRQAIEVAIDRQALLDLVGGGVPTLTRVTPPTPCSDPTLYDQVGEYDPERAKALIQESGYNGEPLTFHASLAFPMEKEVAEVIAAMLEEVGLTIDLQVMDTSAFREQIYVPNKNEELYLDALGNSFFDPWITVLSEQSDRRERSGWSGPEADRADELIRAAAVNMDPKERCEQYIELQNLLRAANGGPYVYLYQMEETMGLNNRVNFTPSPDGFLWFGDASLK
jgi:peptide/nickel transport system substrate-binding protein